MAVKLHPSPIFKYSCLSSFRKPIDSKAIHLIPNPGHPHRKRNLLPIPCLSLYNTTIQAPQNPPIFFEAVADSMEYILPKYPNKNCQYFCGHDIPIVIKANNPVVVTCPYISDEVYNNRLEKFVGKNVTLQLSNFYKDIQQPLNPVRITKLLNIPAFVYFGTLLGSWRDEGIIPHLRDLDIGLPVKTDWRRVKLEMWYHGFYVFSDYIFRACVASHHPLSPLLYSKNINLLITKSISSTLVKDKRYDHGTPYLDIYTSEERQNRIAIQTAAQLIPKNLIFPLNCHERILGMPIPSIVYPEAMFHTEYGASYTLDHSSKLEDCESYCDYQLLYESNIP
ncbi:hypothetical protein THRCLA_11382 [Thraustotheca clavata]|uniref:Uncharacterized protein n=1 Tax=Thraustotheca clavata TaxID=74557 RepID=A0A1V9Y7X6_9STRA|nr:hypothetical protein THRCLA_11382 [Thraustotheca clavata]